MRLYTFTHFMLSSIQQGIQSGHVSQVITNKYIDARKSSKELKALKEWLPAPTIVCLNGGNSGELNRIFSALENLGTFLKLPFDKFNEDADSMEGIMTSCGIIVPARIYDTAALLRTKPDGYLTMLPTDLHDAELQLAELLNKYQLAK